jgi:hypothetical protein
MDQSALTRRRLLGLAGIGLGASALTACTDGVEPPETPAPVPTGPTATALPAPATPLTVWTSSGSFVSAFRPGIASHWSLAAPELPPGAAQPELPVAVFLHGLGGSHAVLLEDLAAHEPLQRHLDACGTPFAIAAVDGGKTWWHPRADGSDTQSMLVKEFVPFLGSQGYDLGRIAAPGTTLPPRFAPTAQDCRARSRVGSGPAATTTATGAPSCPRCCPFWATTSPEPAAGKIVRC